MARIDNTASGSPYPAIDNPLDIDSTNSASQVRAPHSPEDVEIRAESTGSGITNFAPTSPVTDPIDKLFALARFNAAGTPAAASSAATAQLAASGLVGQRLGVNHYGEEVRVTREVGSPQGYANKFEAIAAARLGKAEPAALLQDALGKWHAVETTANFSGGMAAGDVSNRAVQGLASSADIAKLRDTVVSLRQELETPHNNEDRETIVDQFVHAQSELASLLFGVPESEINFDYKNPSPGKINLVPAKQLPDGATGITKMMPGDDFAHRPVVIELDINKLLDPAGAGATLFHEATHMQDLEFAQAWVGKYEQQTNHKVTPGDTAKFQDWLKTQVSKGGLTKADQEVVLEEVQGGRAVAEARAHVHAAMAALQGGTPGVATRELVNYVVDLKNHDYANLADDGKAKRGAAVMDALTHEIQAAYRQMSPAMRHELETAIAGAKQQNPDAWLSKVTLQR